MPKRTNLDIANKNFAQKQKKSGAKAIVKFLFKGNMFSLVLSAYAVVVLMSGYKSFIFPMLADMSGVSKSDVSNISVFANALAFYAAPLFTAIQKKSGSIKIIISSELIIAVLFMIFAFNSSFIWACCVFLISQILYKLIPPCASDC